MKKTLRKCTSLASLVAGVMTSASLAGSAQAQTSDALLDTLVKKGILTEQESEDLKSDLAQEHVEKSGKDVRFFWKDGLNFQSVDKKTFTGKLGGRVQWDTGIFDADRDIENGLGDQDSGTEFRRVRIALEGTVNTSVPTFYKAEVDFAGAEVAFKDVYLGLDELPGIGSFTAGHMKEPVGLETITSSRFLTFVERSTTMEAFAPERNTGAKIGDSVVNDRVTWSVGGFTDVDDSGDGPLDDDWAVSGRVTGLPLYDEESKGRTLLHLGLSSRHATPADDTARFRSRPEAHLADRFADTGLIDAERYWTVGGEVAGVFGPFSFQGELIQTWVKSDTSNADPNFLGAYGLVSYFLTGENRVYKPSSAAFDRVKPNKNFSLKDGGPGAWELAARASWLDLNDAGINGGELFDVTTGVNWYLNPNFKIQINYVWADLSDREVGVAGGGPLDGNMHSILTRFAADF